MKNSFCMALVLSMPMFLLSCASKRDHKDSAHHHHECTPENCRQEKCEKYDKLCATSLAHGDLHTEGKEEFMLTHGGHNYYFSSKQAMNEFKKNIDDNIKAAEKNWQSNRGHK